MFVNTTYPLAYKSAKNKKVDFFCCYIFSASTKVAKQQKKKGKKTAYTTVFLFICVRTIKITIYQCIISIQFEYKFGIKQRKEKKYPNLLNKLSALDLEYVSSIDRHKKRPFSV